MKSPPTAAASSETRWIRAVLDGNAAFDSGFLTTSYPYAEKYWAS